MGKVKRNWVPCRECNTVHNNPASSSICCKCGKLERLKNLDIKKAIRELEKSIIDGDYL